jgi:hypothetical protein
VVLGGICIEEIECWECTVGLVVRSLADIVPLASLCASDDELGEGVMGAGRAGDSEKGGEGVLHFDRVCGDLDDDVYEALHAVYIQMPCGVVTPPEFPYITALRTLVWYFILRTECTRWSGIPDG